MSLRNRPEYIQDILMPLGGVATTGLIGPQEVGLVNRVPLDKPLFGCMLNVRLRAATGGTTAGVTLAEAAQNFVQRVRIVGTHKQYGTREIVNLRGASLYVLGQKYSFGTALPLVSNLPAAGVAPAITTNYDINFGLYVPFVPRGIPKLQQMLFLVRNDEWATFDIYVTFGDANALFVFGAGQVVTFTDYQSAAGVPRAQVSVIRTILGDARTLIKPAIMRWQFQPITSPFTAANVTDTPLQDCTVGFKVSAYLIKSGVAPATSNGVFGFTSLSDGILTRPKIKLDNVTIKDAISPLIARMYSQSEFGGPLPVGYSPIEFAEGHDGNTYFRGDKLDRSNKLQLAGDVTAAANQQGELVEELVEGDPELYQPRTSGS